MMNLHDNMFATDFLKFIDREHSKLDDLYYLKAKLNREDAYNTYLIRSRQFVDDFLMNNMFKEVLTNLNNAEVDLVNVCGVKFQKDKLYLFFSSVDFEDIYGYIVFEKETENSE